MKKGLLAVLFLIMIQPIMGQKLFTLDEAIKIGLQGNPLLNKQSNNLSISKSQLKSAYGDLLPNLGASATWGWQRVDDAGGTQVDFFGNVVPIPPSQNDSRSYSLGLGGNWRIFDGLANWSNVSQKEKNLESAELSLEKLKQDIVFRTSELYYLVLNSEEMMKVREENVKFNQKFLETVEERHRLGAVAMADVYSQQVQAGNAELLLIEAQNNFEISKINLLNYLGLDVLEEYTFTNPYEINDQINTDKYLNEFDEITVMVNQAFEKRSDYKSQKLMLDAAEDGVTIANSGYLPSLTGNYSLSTGAISPKDLFDRKIYSAGLTLSLPIFSNWNTELAVQSAIVGVKNQEEDLSALERNIKIEIKQGYLDLVAAKKSLDVASKTVVSSGENRKINQERYNLGSGTILDVLQADRDYTDALRNKINAEYNFYKSKDALKNSLGNLDYKKFELN